MAETWKIGDVKIHRVIEYEGPTRMSFLLPDAEAEALERHAWLRPHFLMPPEPGNEGLAIMTIQAFVVESGGLSIVVDTCVGNDKPRAMRFWDHLETSFLEDLAEAGFPADRIDRVLCTHLHVDHVGWNTRLRDEHWVPTFPSARYLFGREEWRHWESVRTEALEDQHLADSVVPILDAGLADLVETDHRLTDEVWLEPTPGHSPGHVSVRIASRGEEAVITGDVFHHPVQCSEPDWASSFDFDQDAARRTRRGFLERYQDGPVLVIGTHFATPTGGRIVRDGDAWRFDVD